MKTQSTLITVLAGTVALLTGVTAHAAVPSPVGKSREVVSITQTVNNGVSASAAYVAPMVNSTAGFGPNVLRTPVANVQAIGQMPVFVPMAGSTEAQILAQATAWVNTNATPLANQFSGWMKSYGVSYAWFTYRQIMRVGYVSTVSGSTGGTGGTGGFGGGGGGGTGGGKVAAYLQAIDTDTGDGGGGGGSTGGSGSLTAGTEERLLLWTMSTDQYGRLLYGSPKIVAASPKNLKVVYTPLKVDTSLPQSWQYPDNPGKFFVQTRDVNYNVIPGTDEIVDVQGAYDEPVDSGGTLDPDGSVKAMIQGGAGQKSVVDLMSERAASFAVVDYVRKVQPVYRDNGADEQVPDAKIDISDRTLTYDCDNSATYYNAGQYSIRLVSKMTRYLVSANGQYSAISEAQSIDPSMTTQAYSGNVAVSSTDASNIDSLVIDPVNLGSVVSTSTFGVPVTAPGVNVIKLTCKWVVGGWSVPAGCGTVTATANPASCVRSDGVIKANSYCGAWPTMQTTDMSACPPPPPPPPPDPLPPAYTYSLSASAWSSCSASCGGGTQTRSVSCTRSDGASVDASYCGADTVQACNTQACSGGPSYTYTASATDWSACSASCGGGTQSRSVWCTRSDGATVDNAFCGNPATSQSCNTQACSYTYSATLGDWSACSASCGVGTQSRSVICTRSDGAIVGNTNCGSPASTQSCTGASSCAPPPISVTGVSNTSCIVEWLDNQWTCYGSSPAGNGYPAWSGEASSVSGPNGSCNAPSMADCAAALQSARGW